MKAMKMTITIRLKENNYNKRLIKRPLIKTNNKKKKIKSSKKRGGPISKLMVGQT